MASVEFERPPWLLDTVLTTAEVAYAVEVGIETVRGWLKAARFMGSPLHKKVGSRQVANAHQAYVLAILAALHKADIDCTPDLIRAAIEVTHDDGAPRLPQLFEAIALNEEADGKPVAQIVVDLGQIWLTLHPKLDALMKEAA